MRAVFQMDHPSRLNPPTDSTFMLIEEAQHRGHECFYYEASQLSWYKGELVAPLCPIRVDTTAPNPVTLGTPERASLADTAVVWMRQDPPFNLHYINATYLLEHILPYTDVVNHPVGVRNAPEKLGVLHLHSLMPPTLVSADPALVQEFAEMHGTVIAKPLHGNGGRGVFKFSATDPNIDTLLEQQREQSGEPLMWQAFLPEVATADMRVILVDGEIGASFQREPQGGSIRANMRVGGIAKVAQLSDRQQEICATLKPLMQQNGILFAGVDLIGDYLTEINITSPTGLRAVQQLYGTNLASAMWDKLG